MISVDFEVELSGFSTGEIDLLIDSPSTPAGSDPADETSGFAVDGPAVSRLGDVWELGRHRLICADARQLASYEPLMRGDLAEMVVTDPPYNVRISGHAMGRGKARHHEFAMASGELSEADFTSFLADYMRCAITFSRSGSIHFHFMDWRHLPELLAAARPLYGEWKNLLVWNKTNAGQGSFYRSQHELVGVFKSGEAPHINNFGMGATGRHRTNVQTYPGVNSLHPARSGDLELHPTVKPTALIADLIRDCSRRRGLILDPFGGSGTTILAAERAGRTARVIEIDPLYVDVAIRRFERIVGLPASHAGTRLNFSDLAAERGCPPSAARAARSAGDARSRADRK